jgi:thiol-disulfide isomerase/thioredoxin
MPSFKFFILPLIVMTLLFGNRYGLAQQAGKVENFVLYDVNGRRGIFHDLFSSLPRNGMLILNFTSIHCLPCRKEIPELATIAATAGNRAKLVCVYAECGDPVRESATSLNVLNSAYTDSFGNIQKLFNVKKIPVTIIINKNLTLVERFEGYTPESIQKIKAILSK